MSLQATKRHYDVTVALTEDGDDGNPEFLIGVDAHNEKLALAYAKQDDDFHFEPGHYTIRVRDGDKCVLTQTFESFGRFSTHEYAPRQSDFAQAMRRDMAAQSAEDGHGRPEHRAPAPARDAGVAR